MRLAFSSSPPGAYYRPPSARPSRAARRAAGRMRLVPRRTKAERMRADGDTTSASAGPRALSPQVVGAAPRPLAGGVAMSAASRSGVVVASAITSIATARILGPDGMGTYSLAQSLTLILTIV